MSGWYDCLAGFGIGGIMIGAHYLRDRFRGRRPNAPMPASHREFPAETP